MLDQITFMETVRSVQDIVRTSSQPLTKEEIEFYFKDMELTQTQQEMVFEYVMNSKNSEIKELEEPEELEEPMESEELDGLEEPMEPEELDGLEEPMELEALDGLEEPMESEELEGLEKPRDSNKLGGAGKAGSSAHFQLYLDEIKEIPKLTSEEIQELYQHLFAGEEHAVVNISNQWLTRVIDLAREYVNREILLDDIVQEGNIGLLMGLKKMLGQGEQENIEQVLITCIRDSIEEFLEEEVGEDTQESTILAKVSLIHEAQEKLAKEQETIPTIEELVNYTKISEEEIRDILALARKVKNKE